MVLMLYVPLSTGNRLLGEGGRLSYPILDPAYFPPHTISDGGHCDVIAVGSPEFMNIN